MFNKKKRDRYFELSLLPDIDLPRVERGGKRHYRTPEGNEYPSVTTLLSTLGKDAIEKWREKVGEEEAERISQQASTRGTAVHLLCEDYIHNKDDYLVKHMPANIDTFNLIKPHLDKHVGIVYGNELRMYSDTLRTAGTCDLVAEIDGVLTIGDFKTAKKWKKEEWITNYFYQCVAYAVMLYERHGMVAKQFQLMIANDEGELQIVTKRVADYLPEVVKFFSEVER